MRNVWIDPVFHLTYVVYIRRHVKKYHMCSDEEFYLYRLIVPIPSNNIILIATYVIVRQRKIHSQSTRYTIAKATKQ